MTSGDIFGGQIGDFFGVPVAKLAKEVRLMTTFRFDPSLIAHSHDVPYDELMIPDPDPEIPQDYQDLGTCPYYRSGMSHWLFNPVDYGQAYWDDDDGRIPGVCGFHCTEEPACTVDEPVSGWPSMWIFTDVELPFDD